jgi:hypothetical protein
MSVIIKQKIEGQIDIQALKTVFDMAGHAVQAPGRVTVHNRARGTHEMDVSLHIPAEVLTALGLRAGRRSAYGLGLKEMENGDVEVVFDAFYASPDMRSFVRKLGNLSRIAKLKGSRINLLYNHQEDQVLVHLAPGGGQGSPGSPAGNAFMPLPHGKVRS